jgi:hypothetical protein
MLFYSSGITNSTIAKTNLTSEVMGVMGVKYKNSGSLTGKTSPKPPYGGLRDVLGVN